MASFQYFVASSLDGFIATDDDNLAWLLQFDGFEGGQDSYDAFIADVGCIVMGGETYAWLLEHEPGTWPYPGTPCWVFTHHEHSAPKGANVTFVRGSVREFVDDLKEEAAGRNIWVVGGGVLAAQFADAGLLDELIRLGHSRGAGQRQATAAHDRPDAATGAGLVPHHGARHRGAALPFPRPDLLASPTARYRGSGS